MNYGPQNFKQRASALKERLRAPEKWLLLPSLLSFAFVLILTGHLLSGLNPRIGNQADILSLDAPSLPEGGLWLSVYPKSSMVHVSTFDGKMFSWPADTNNLKPLLEFKAYLEGVVSELASQAVIAKFISNNQTRVVLSVDQHLRYFHIRPIIQVLSIVGLDSYAFETKVFKSVDVASSQSQGEQSSDKTIDDPKNNVEDQSTDEGVF